MREQLSKLKKGDLFKMTFVKIFLKDLTIIGIFDYAEPYNITTNIIHCYAYVTTRGMCATNDYFICSNDIMVEKPTIEEYFILTQTLKGNKTFFNKKLLKIIKNL